MKTETLLNALRSCKGAIESASIYPIFSHFCFSESVVYSFNDWCAVVAPLDSGLELGLKAEVLLGVLPTLGEEITITSSKEKGMVMLRSSGTDLSLPSLPASSFMFVVPGMKTQLTIYPTAEFFAGLDKCRRTVGSNALARAFTGVAFDFNKGLLTAYSSDDIRLSRFVVSDDVELKPTKGIAAGQWLVPGRACELLSEAFASAPEGEEVTITLDKDWLAFSAPNVAIYCKLLADQPPDYADTLRRLGAKGWIWQELPQGFAGMVKRAEVLSSKDVTAGVQLSVKGKVINAVLDAGLSRALGSFDDKIKLKTALDEVSLTFNTNKLSEAIEGVEEFALNERGLALRSGGYTCWVSPTHQAEE